MVFLEKPKEEIPGLSCLGNSGLENISIQKKGYPRSFCLPQTSNFFLYGFLGNVGDPEVGTLVFRISSCTGPFCCLAGENRRKLLVITSHKAPLAVVLKDTHSRGNPNSSRDCSMEDTDSEDNSKLGGDSSVEETQGGQF